MNCNLTNDERKRGNRCRSWDCTPCKEHGLSVNDATIINVHMDNMTLKKENADLKRRLNKCKDDYWFMINLIERYGSDKDQTLKDCLERMKFRQPLFKSIESNKGERE